MDRLDCKSLPKALLAIIFCVTLFSCKDDEPPIVPESLPLSGHTLFFTPDSQESKTIEATVSGTVTIAPGYEDWIIASAVGQTIEVQVSELTEESGRTGQLTILSANQSATLTIVQAGTADLLQADRQEFTFLPFPTVSKTIKIEGVTELAFEGKPLWLDISTSGNTITLTAQDNDRARERSAELIFYSGTKFMSMVIAQRANVPFELYHLDTGVGMIAGAVSGNGRFVAGQRSGVSFVWDVELDEVYYTEGDIYGISDEGIGFGTFQIRLYNENGDLRMPDMPGYYDYRTDVWTLAGHDAIGVTDLEDYHQVGSGYGRKITPDGRIAVGNISANRLSGKGYSIGGMPIYWLDGKSHLLEYYEKDNLGQYAPQRYSVGCISDDGSRIAGSQIDNSGFTEVVCYWNTSDGKIHKYGEGNKDVFDIEFIEWVVPGETYRANINRFTYEAVMSRDGNYIAAKVRDGKTNRYWPVILDVETQTYTSLPDLRGYSPICAFNNGAMLLTTGGRFERAAYYWYDDTLLDFTKWMLTEYDYMITSNLAVDITPMAVNSDGTRIVGFSDDLEENAVRNFYLYLPRK